MKAIDLKESIKLYPKEREDFDKLDIILSSPLTGQDGFDKINTVIQDTALNADMEYKLAKGVEYDFRELVVDWIRTNMPYALHDHSDANSNYSPISRNLTVDGDTYGT